MGYACPVCSDPQADGGHLANHLAFTAMLGDDAHEAWLDEHVPGWEELGETELADVATEKVEAVEFPQVFEDTVGGLDDDGGDPPAERSGVLFDDAAHGHDHADRAHASRMRDRGGAGEPTDEETAAVLEEAREMTRRMLADEGNESDEDNNG